MISINNNTPFQLCASYLNDVSTPHIQDIKSKKARNLLRGISDSSDYNHTKKTLEKIKLCCKYSDYKIAVEYVRTNKSFEGNSIGQLFNNYCPKGLSDTVIFSFNEIALQIQHHLDALLLIGKKSAELISYLSINDLESALNSCKEIVKENGVSVFLLRMISFITNRYHLLGMDNSEIPDEIDKLKLNICFSNTPFIGEAITQLSNLRTVQLAVNKRINEFESKSPFCNIAKSFINPVPNNEKEYLIQLSSYYSFSLFDAFLYIKNTNIMELPFKNKELFLDSRLQDVYKQISGIEFLPEKMYESIDQDTGYHYLRECFLFPEQPKAIKYQIIHGYYYSDGKNIRRTTGYVNKLITHYFSNVNNLSDIHDSDMNDIEINSNKYDKKSCGMLENSSALIHILNKKEGVLSEEDEMLFVKLMTYTRDIGEICNPEYLACIADSAKNMTLKLVARCLVSINDKKHYAEYELRSIIQEYCIAEFDGNLNKLLQHLYSISPAVTEHFILTCNETFLSTLFHLMEKPVDALEVRADMLHWFGTVTNEDRYIDRAKTLRIDIQLNKERGTIDDSRIYVDPLKYSQWFEDNMISKLTMVLDPLMISNNKMLILDWDKKNTSVGGTDIVIDHLLACYSEFCSNNMFGIASYLGRRIRHGTFKGTAITEVSELSKKEEYAHLFEEKDFKLKFDSWLRNYEKMIEDLVKTFLQIKSRKKPSGVITTEIDSPTKKQYANQMVYDILSIYNTRSGVIQLPSLIMDYCWRLVESDLVKLRKLLSEKKSSHAVFSYTPKSISGYRRREYSKFSQEVNTVTNKKFGLISSWFNKPSYASPSTEIYLLFRAVVSEVKGNVSHFDPRIDLDDRSFSIAGGTYYVIYDALYVLIHNAAIHGKPNGEIHFHVSKPENRQALRINLSTELSSIFEIQDAHKKINAALAELNDDAHIVEGNSGIKKLKRMEKDGSISGIRFIANEKDLKLEFEFYFELDSRGKYEDLNS